MPLQTDVTQLLFPKVNGHELSRTSTDLLFGGVKVVGWTELNFKWSRAPGKSYASRANPQARTRGKVTYTASLTVYETTWSVLYAYLAAQGRAQGIGPSEMTVDVILTYFEPTLFSGVKKIKLVGAQVTEAEQSISDADDQLVRKLTLDIMGIEEDGISPVAERMPNVPTAPGI